MIKLNTILFAVFALVASLATASGAADAKHCAPRPCHAPRPCCGCPGNGKPKIKALMNVFLDRLQENNRSDAFQLVAANDGSMRNYNGEQCLLTVLSISDYYDVFFPVKSIFINADKKFTERHDGSIDVEFLAVVTDSGTITRAYDMVYKWSQDAQCNWHIANITGVDHACLLPPSFE